VAIGSNTTTLSFDDVVSSFLLEDMRQGNMETQNTNDLCVRGLSHEMNKSNSSSERSKYRRRSKSP